MRGTRGSTAFLRPLATLGLLDAGRLEVSKAPSSVRRCPDDSRGAARGTGPGLELGLDEYAVRRLPGSYSSSDPALAPAREEEEDALAPRGVRGNSLPWRMVDTGSRLDSGLLRGKPSSSRLSGGIVGRARVVVVVAMRGRLRTTGAVRVPEDRWLILSFWTALKGRTMAAWLLQAVGAKGALGCATTGCWERRG